MLFVNAGSLGEAQPGRTESSAMQQPGGSQAEVEVWRKAGPACSDSECLGADGRGHAGAVGASALVTGLLHLPIICSLGSTDTRRLRVPTVERQRGDVCLARFVRAAWELVMLTHSSSRGR